MNSKLICAVAFLTLAIGMSFAAGFLHESAMILMGIICSLAVGGVFLVYGLFADFENDFRFYLEKMKADKSLRAGSGNEIAKANLQAKEAATEK